MWPIPPSWFHQGGLEVDSHDGQQESLCSGVSSPREVSTDGERRHPARGDFGVRHVEASGADGLRFVMMFSASVVGLLLLAACALLLSSVGASAPIGLRQGRHGHAVQPQQKASLQHVLSLVGSDVGASVDAPPVAVGVNTQVIDAPKVAEAAASPNSDEKVRFTAAPTQASKLSGGTKAEAVSDLDAAESSLLASLSHRAKVVAPSMAVQDVVDTLKAYVGLQFWPGHETLVALEKRLENLAPEMTARQVGDVLGAYVGLKTRPQASLLAALSKRMEQVVPQLGILDLFHILKAFQVMEVSPQGSLWEALESKAQQEAPKMDSHEVASTLTICALLKHRPASPLVEALGRRAQEKAASMPPQDVAEILNAYAKLMLQPGELLLQALLLRAEQVAPAMNAKQVAGTLNAYARLEQGAPSDRTWARPTPTP